MSPDTSEVAVVGMSLNLFVLIFIQRIDSIRKPFVQTSVSQTIGDFTVLFTFAAYAAPLTLFPNAEFFNNKVLSRFMGQLNVTAYVACMYTHLVRSSCRFMAISYPMSHSRIFTMRNTIGALLIVWAFAVLQTVVYLVDGCSFGYSVQHYGFIFADTPCGHTIKMTVDFAQYLLVIIVVAVLDALTIFRIHQVYARVRVNEMETQLRRKRETRLFVQLRQVILKVPIKMPTFLHSPNPTHLIDTVHVAVVGMSLNLFVLIFIQRIDSIRKPFVQTSVSQTIGDFTVLFTPNAEFFNNKVLSRFMGQLNVTAYVACMYTHLVRSSCRFMAISYPMSHSRIFTMRNTIGALLIVWAFAVLQTVVYLVDGCSFGYSVQHYGFIFADTPCGHTIKMTVDFAQYLLVIIVVAVLDALTIFRIHQVYARVRVNEMETQLRRKRETRLFVQAVLQDSAFVALLVSYMFISSILTNKWAAFFFTTFAWEMVHSLDGVIAIACNPGLRSLLLPPCFRGDKVNGNGNEQKRNGSAKITKAIQTKPLPSP
ncbi:Serpentine receptor class X 45 [Toxocara canis]|uniref:Serpentine receptor class X 45 n=1 Tax=Toxocara canis TaxID=6265 RepID=A0A0B2V1T4_TOXCA|nr:Serpentine receptor class X 45 [Toxocara canis]